MSNSELIPEEVMKLVGQEVIEPLTLEIEKGAIHKFALALDDPNRLWYDKEISGQSIYKSIIAQPTFLSGLGLEEWQKFMMKLPLGNMKRVLAEGMELENYQPVFPGDVITVRTKLAEIKETETKLGRMIVLVAERTFFNQDDKIVSKDWVRAARY